MEKQTSQLVIVEDSAICPPKDIAAFRKLATDAVNQHKKAVKAYWALCCFIRQKQLTPEVVTQELKERGYPESRISEIKRVAFCADAIFEDYRKGVVGFRFVLEQARSQKLALKDEQTELPSILKPENQLKADLVDALQSVIPVAGPLPLLLRYRFPIKVNGYVVTITVKKDKTSTKSKK